MQHRLQVNNEKVSTEFKKENLESYQFMLITNNARTHSNLQAVLKKN